MIIKRCGYLWRKDCNRKITFICDSKSALSEVEIDSTKWKDRDFMGSEVDLIMTIDSLKDENDNIRRIYQWEKVHQVQSEDES